MVVTRNGCEVLINGAGDRRRIEALMAAAKSEGSLETMSKVNLAIIGGGLVGAWRWPCRPALGSAASLISDEPCPAMPTSPATTPALRRCPTAAGRSA